MRLKDKPQVLTPSPTAKVFLDDVSGVHCVLWGDLVALAQSIADNSIPSVKLKTTADADKVQLANLAAAVLAVLQGGLDPAQYQGEWIPATNTPTIPAAAPANAGNWYQTSAAGTATGNAAGTYAKGDRILSNGVAWLKMAAPPTVLADGVVTRPKLDAGLDAEVPKFVADLPSLLAMVDTAGRKGFWLDVAGYICGKLNLATDNSNGISFDHDRSTGRTFVRLGTVDGVIPWGPHSLHILEDNEVYFAAVLDNANRIALGLKRDGTLVAAKFEVPEVVTARGSTASLNARLSKFLNDDGMPALGAYNQERLRDWRRLAFDLQLGSTTSKPSILMLGDSWVEIGINFLTYVTRRLKAIYGTSGEGYQTVCPPTGQTACQGPSDGVNGSVTRTGSWSVQTAYDGRGCDLKETTSSTVGDKITVNLLVAADSAVIHYLLKTGGGSFRWRVNGGSWTTVNTVNAGDVLGTVTIASLPAPPIAVELEVLTAGTTGVTLFGVDWKKNTAGVRLHRLGHAGSHSAQWKVASPIFEQALTQIAPHVVFVVLGTNDQALALNEDGFKLNIETIISRLRATRAGMDIVLVAPSENLSGRVTPMTVYRDALLRVAQEQRCAILDLVRHFGDSASEYNQTSPRVLFDGAVSSVHLTDDGQKYAADCIIRLLTSL